MRGPFVLASLCVLLSSCAPSSSRPVDTPGSKAIEIPIVIRNHLPMVHVLVDGIPFDLYLDLEGHNSIGLTADELARSSVRFLPTTERYRIWLGQVFVARHFVAPSVVVGGVPFGDLVGMEYVLPPAGGPPDRNGYIGKELLRKYLLVLDYPHKRVRLYPPGDDEAFRYECGRPQFSVVEANDTFISFAETEYGRLSFEWDTGATQNFIRPSVLGHAADNARKVDEGAPIVSIAPIRLGAKNLGPLVFRVLQYSSPNVDAIFGTTLFASRKVCLDFSTGRGSVTSPVPSPFSD